MGLTFGVITCLKRIDKQNNLDLILQVRNCGGGGGGFGGSNDPPPPMRKVHFDGPKCFVITELLASNFHNCEPVLINVFHMCQKHVCFCIFSILLYKLPEGALRSHIK